MHIISAGLLLIAVICFAAAAVIGGAPQASRINNVGLACFAGAALVAAVGI